MIEVNGHYIMQDEKIILQELKRQLAINNIIRFSKIITSGDNVQTTCPFHSEGQERKPSFGILTKDKGKSVAGSCHCFSCGWSGPFSEMVSNCFGYADMGIFGGKWLIRNFLSVAIESRPDLDLKFERQGELTKSKYVDEKELESYRIYNPYMWKRKMTPEMVDIFDIGFDSKTNSLTFPIKDENGNCLYIARRSTVTKFFHYPENVDKPVYGLWELKNINPECEEVIICESMINAITVWVYGKYGVALNGTGTELQYEQLRRMKARKFILAFDPDKAGDAGKVRIRKALTNKIITEYKIPINKDINDLTKSEFLNLSELF